jgi:hypothetical protein
MGPALPFSRQHGIVRDGYGKQVAHHLIKVILENRYSETIRSVPYEAGDHQPTRFPLFPLQAPVGAAQEHEGRAACLPEMQESLLEQTTQKEVEADWVMDPS